MPPTTNRDLFEHGEENPVEASCSCSSFVLVLGFPIGCEHEDEDEGRGRRVAAGLVARRLETGAPSAFAFCPWWFSSFTPRAVS
jgi:hypothetical protein